MAHENYMKVREWLESEGIREMIKSSLPSSMDTDSWINAALTHIGSDKDVLQAEPKSTLGAVLEAATMGLRFEGPLGEAYLEARSSKYKDGNTWKWRKLTQLQVQYRGLMKLARRDPLVRKVEAILVYANDAFEHRLGSDPFLHHTWDVRKPRGKIVAVYAALRYQDGYYDFGQPYSMDAIWKHRERVLADKNIRIENHPDGTEVFWKRWKDDEPEKQMSAAQIRRIPWITYIEAMAQKTAVRWSAKFWDLNPDFDRAAALVSMAESGRSQKLEEMVRQVVPVGMLGSDEPDSVTKQTVQGSSLHSMGNLKERMLAEAGHGQGEMDGPPPDEAHQAGENSGNDQAQAEGPVEAEGGEAVASEPTDEEKAEIRAREREEAEEFLRQQEGGTGGTRAVNGSTGRRGGRSKRK